MTRSTVEARIKAHPVSGTVGQMRAAFEALAASPATAGGIPFKRNGVPGRRFGSGPDVVWLHGGGYVFGSSDSHAACASYLAHAAGCTVWVPDYRLAPEVAWPAPLEDALALLDSFPSPISVVGDSAGGHLALNVALRDPQAVSALALISPNTDRSDLSTTRTANTPHDLMNADHDDTALYRLAMPETDPTAIAASPLLGDLSTLPPVWLTAATNEVLLDDTLLLTVALGRAGVPVTTRIEQGLFHLWTLWPDHLEKARTTLTHAAAFLSAHARAHD